jgi:hypothetical protein
MQYDTWLRPATLSSNMFKIGCTWAILGGFGWPLKLLTLGPPVPTATFIASLEWPPNGIIHFSAHSPPTVAKGGPQKGSPRLTAPPCVYISISI